MAFLCVPTSLVGVAFLASLYTGPYLVRLFPTVVVATSSSSGIPRPIEPIEATGL